MREPTDDPGRGQPPFSAIFAFLIITFGLAWSIMALYLCAPHRVEAAFGEISASHPLFVLAVYSPAIAAITVVFFHAGVKGLGSYLSRLLLWRIPSPWWMFLLLGIPAIYFACALVKGNASTAPLFVEPLAAMLFHFQLNNPLWPDAQPYDTIFFVAVAAVIVWLNRAAMLRRGGVTRVMAPDNGPRASADAQGEG